MKAIEIKQDASQDVKKQQRVVGRASQKRFDVVTRVHINAKTVEIITSAIENTSDAILEVKRINAANPNMAVECVGYLLEELRNDDAFEQFNPFIQLYFLDKNEKSL